MQKTVPAMSLLSVAAGRWGVAGLRALAIGELDLYGQERGAVRALLSGSVIEEHCGRVSPQQSPIGEGWEVNELREGLVASS